MSNSKEYNDFIKAGLAKDNLGEMHTKVDLELHQAINDLKSVENAINIIDDELRNEPDKASNYDVDRNILSRYM